VSRSNIELRGNSALQFLLGINTPQTNPETVDLSSVNPVVEMSMQGFSHLHYTDRYLSINSTGNAMAGVQTKTYRMLSSGNAVGADTQIIVPIGCHFICFGASVTMVVDAAGSAAINNKFITCAIEMVMPNSDVVKKWRAMYLGNTNNRHYYDGVTNTEKITRNHLCVVPSSCALSLVIYTEDGSNFPANTTMEYFISGMSIPIGAPLPIGV